MSTFSSDSPAHFGVLHQRVSIITARLDALNRRRQADQYRKLADERSWLIAQLLPHVPELDVALSLLAAMRGDALTYGREMVRTMILVDPSRYEESVWRLSLPDLLLLASVLESVDDFIPDVSAFAQRVRQLASAAHQQLIG